MDFKQEGMVAKADDDEAVARVREFHGLLNECAAAAGIPTRLSTTAVSVGPGTAQLFIEICKAAYPLASVDTSVPVAMVGTLQRVGGYTAGDISAELVSELVGEYDDTKRILAYALAAFAKKPGFFKKHWKKLAIGGVAVVGLVLYFRSRSRKQLGA